LFLKPNVKIFFAGLVIILIFAGCSEPTAEMEKKILAYDPSFQKLLNKRNAVRGEADKQKAVFRAKKQVINNKIKVMQEEKTRLDKEYTSLEEKTMRQIQPGKRELRKALMELGYQYKQKAEALRSIDRDINEINSLINKKESLSLTQEEMRIWNDRLAALIEKKEIQSLEKSKLKEEIEITKLKIKVFS